MSDIWKAPLMHHLDRRAETLAAYGAAAGSLDDLLTTDAGRQVARCQSPVVGNRAKPRIWAAVRKNGTEKRSGALPAQRRRRMA